MSRQPRVRAPAAVTVLKKSRGVGADAASPLTVPPFRRHQHLLHPWLKKLHWEMEGMGGWMVALKCFLPLALCPTMLNQCRNSRLVVCCCRSKARAVQSMYRVPLPVARHSDAPESRGRGLNLWDASAGGGGGGKLAATNLAATCWLLGHKTQSSTRAAQSTKPSPPYTFRPFELVFFRNVPVFTLIPI